MPKDGPIDASLQTTHAICSLGGLAQAIGDPLCILGAYLAAIVHDFEHQGKYQFVLM